MYISTLTLTIIAVDRYVIIIHPFRARMQVKTCAVLILLIDLMAMGFTAPYAFHVRLVDVGGDKTLCYETWEGAPRTAYGFFTLLSQFVMPFATVIACYSAIIRRLRERSAAGARPGAPARSAASRRREEQERARAVRTNRMLISMVAVFGACWLPLNSINFVADLGVVNVSCWAYYHLVFFVAHVMAMSSTCYNPFLYGWHNESFRQEFVKMLPVLRGVCGTSGGPTLAAAGGRCAPDIPAGEATLAAAAGDNGFSRIATAHRGTDPQDEDGDDAIEGDEGEGGGEGEADEEERANARESSCKNLDVVRFNGLTVEFGTTNDAADKVGRRRENLHLGPAST